MTTLEDMVATATVAAELPGAVRAIVEGTFITSEPPDKKPPPWVPCISVCDEKSRSGMYAEPICTSPAYNSRRGDSHFSVLATHGSQVSVKQGGNSMVVSPVRALCSWPMV